MTISEIPTASTARLPLHGLRAGDLDTCAAMRANPETEQDPVSGRTATSAEVCRTTALVGPWALRGAALEHWVRRRAAR